MKKNRKIALAALTLFTCSAACAGATDALADIGRAAQSVVGKRGEPTLVIAPHTHFNVGNRVVDVVGYDQCR